ncbi:uncharacterized protein BP01DRAFT_357441 [Aspergillus saccharolyticus JOP 1030-1]|uniref:Uncharacterized protein n=1 Tax=Aspergillus saccharolyticus JOP 1030-1 TaxID=1450539 RepID=A0A318ZBD9_9EURO|nr:hypothetical protein BP01DRAFT_357441 [Aspergillus saccharolyticus JOP 1030-1]PYH44771.1 hypothetical protein BP01DRAFT_357441 [Aspergillus saccharolyticus JOP 1030-1]
MHDWLTHVQYHPQEWGHRWVGSETRCGAVVSEKGLLQLCFCRLRYGESRYCARPDDNTYRTTPSYDLSADLEMLIQQLRPLRRFWCLHAEQFGACKRVELKRCNPIHTGKRRAHHIRSRWWHTRGRKALTAAVSNANPSAPVHPNHPVLLAWAVRLRALFRASQGFQVSISHCDEVEGVTGKKTAYECIRIRKKQDNSRVAAVMTAISMPTSHSLGAKKPSNTLVQDQIWCNEAEALCQSGRPAYLATIDSPSGALSFYQIPNLLGPFLPVRSRFLTICGTRSASERLHARLYLNELLADCTRPRVRFAEQEDERLDKRRSYTTKFKGFSVGLW